MYANDLNPDSFFYLKENVRINKVHVGNICVDCKQRGLWIMGSRTQRFRHAVLRMCGHPQVKDRIEVHQEDGRAFIRSSSRRVLQHD